MTTTICYGGSQALKYTVSGWLPSIKRVAPSDEIIKKLKMCECGRPVFYVVGISGFMYNKL